MKTFITVAAVALMATGAYAAGKKSESAQNQRPWMDTIASYSLSHPMEVKCSDFVSAQPAEQEYVVAYLEGHSHGKANVEAVEEDFQPVSVISVTEECKNAPDTGVWDVVKTMTPYMSQ